MENKISVTLAPEALEAIEQNIDNLVELLPFLLSLPEKERRGGFRLGDKNLGFLIKTNDYLNQSPQFMPGYVNIEEVSKDATLAEQLTTIYRKLMVLAGKIEDTAGIAGIEALSGALAYYNSVKEASKSNIAGARTIYEDLKERFPGGRRPESNESE